ncbi:hypothetical protein B0H10DRAFT_1963438 [Mycena sp. CBHHK59/15]|nr:hypothetical protein B0H10DRAFT_1967098 [Mycena sp. CBHHK59/15]KAJ6576742.1 hypothetical protein B0H10DRAFT_1963438 [Mycena sp. CBHHK59/15]
MPERIALVTFSSYERARERYDIMVRQGSRAQFGLTYGLFLEVIRRSLHARRIDADGTRLKQRGSIVNGTRKKKYSGVLDHWVFTITTDTQTSARWAARDDLESWDYGDVLDSLTDFADGSNLRTVTGYLGHIFESEAKEVFGILKIKEWDRPRTDWDASAVLLDPPSWSAKYSIRSSDRSFCHFTYGYRRGSEVVELTDNDCSWRSGASVDSFRLKINPDTKDQQEAFLTFDYTAGDHRLAWSSGAIYENNSKTLKRFRATWMGGWEERVTKGNYQNHFKSNRLPNDFLDVMSVNWRKGEWCTGEDDREGEEEYSGEKEEE